MRASFKYILSLVVIALIIVAFLMHKGLINSELPLQFNTKLSPDTSGTCEPGKE